MKKSRLLPTVALTITFFAIASLGHAQSPENSWITVAPMPTARTDLGIVSLNGNVYAIGGYVHGVAIATNEMFDPIKNSWTEKAPMPTPRGGLAVAVFQNKIYAIGGATAFNQDGGATSLNVNEIYDPVTDSWSTKAPMLDARAFLTANVVNGNIYLIGGGNWASTFTFGAASSNQVYDPQNDSWTAKAQLPQAVGFYASAVVNNKIYIIGGSQSAGTGWKYNQIYDAATDIWSSGKPLPQPNQQDGLYGMACAAITTSLGQSRIFVFGGHDSTNGSYNFTEVYDVLQDNWTMGSPMPTTRYDLAAAVVNGSIYTIGGWSLENAQQYAPSNANERYIPSEYSGPIPSFSPSPTPTPTPTSMPSQSSLLTSAPSSNSSPTSANTLLPTQSFQPTLIPTVASSNSLSPKIYPSPSIPEITLLPSIIVLAFLTLIAIAVASKRKIGSSKALVH